MSRDGAGTLGLNACLIWLSTVAASPPSASPLQASPVAEPQAQAASPSIDEMLQECRTHCQQVTQVLNDIAKAAEEHGMQWALNLVQAQWAEMKGHMNGCMDTVNQMETRYRTVEWAAEPPETISTASSQTQKAWQKAGLPTE